MAFQDHILTDEDILKQLALIRQRIDKLRLEKVAYAGVAIEPDAFQIEVIDGHNSITSHSTVGQRPVDIDTEIICWLHDYAVANNMKIVAAGISCRQARPALAARLWLEEDIVPHFVPSASPAAGREKMIMIARQAASLFRDDQSARVHLSSNNEVIPSSLVDLAHYRAGTSQTLWQQLAALSQSAKNENVRLVFFSSSPQGGGVALMRHALIRLYRLLGVDAHWHVMRSQKDIYEITKAKFHNILQGVARGHVRLTEADKAAFAAWSEDNAKFFRQIIQAADVIVIDDPQPSGLIPHIRSINPKAKIIYRSHIHLETDLIATLGTPQALVWEFLRSNIQQADVFVSHPIASFIPHNVPTTSTVVMPATTDPLDGLNKPLTDHQQMYYLKLFNKILLEQNQTPLDLARPYLIQVARFDPSKGLADVIEAYRQLRVNLNRAAHHTPQLVIVGHSAIDDPDGTPVFNIIMDALRDSNHHRIKTDIKVARLPHIDQMLNALVRASSIVLQLSHREGFEVKVTEALAKGKPVVAYRTGGIPLQIEDGITGYVIDVGDVSQVVAKLEELLSNQSLYRHLSEQATARLNENYLTVSNAAKWLYLATWLHRHGSLAGHGRSVESLMAQAVPTADEPA